MDAKRSFISALHRKLFKELWKWVRHEFHNLPEVERDEVAADAWEKAVVRWVEDHPGEPPFYLEGRWADVEQPGELARIRSFVRVKARWLALNRLRGRAYIEESEVALEKLPEPEKLEAIAKVKEAMEKYPDQRHREALILSLVGYSYDEIADMLATSRSSVGRWIEKAWQCVRDYWAR